MWYRVLAGLGVAVVLVGSITAFVFLSRRGAAKTEETHTTPPARVKVVPATSAYFGEWTELLGTIQTLPNQGAQISAAVDGRVLSILGDGKGSTLNEGDQVLVNQVLVQLDDSVPRAYRERLATTVKELEREQKQVRVVLDGAEKEVKRLEDTSKSGGVLAAAELDKARLTRNDLQSRLTTADAWQGVLQAEIKMLDAHLQHFTIRSPIAGQLGMIQVTPGQAITAGTTVADVVNLENVDVLCYVPPYVAGRLALRQPARLDASEPSTGEVVFIAAQAQADTGNLAVKVRFPNKDVKMRANSVQRVQVQTQPEKLRLAIPEDAILEDEAAPAVLVASQINFKDKSAKAQKLRPVLGVRDRDQHLREIVRLNAKDTSNRVSVRDVLFIVEGAHGLHEGDSLFLTGMLKPPRSEVIDLENAGRITISPRASFTGHTGLIWSLAYSPDGKTLASGSLDTTVKLWDIGTGQNTATFDKNAGGASSVAFDPEGKLLAAGTPFGQLKLWEVASGKPLFDVHAHPPRSNVYVLAFSPDGKLLASGSQDFTVKLWEVPSGKNLNVFSSHISRITALAFSPDGKQVASGSVDKKIQVNDIASGKLVQTLEGHTGVVANLAFSPDGKSLVSWGSNLRKDEARTGLGEIRFWDLTTGRNIRTVLGTATGEKGMFSPDRKTLAWIDGKSVILWDVATAKEIATFQGHTNVVRAVVFSPDGKTLATAGLDNTIKLWDVPSGAPAAE
jgi:RND family efflux transporter MFP subunit